MALSDHFTVEPDSGSTSFAQRVLLRMRCLFALYKLLNHVRYEAQPSTDREGLFTGHFNSTFGSECDGIGLDSYL